jgi:hypothetical protein
MKKIKFKYSLSQRALDHLIQAILIFGSVFLAFLLNERRINQHQTKETQKALKAIVSEIKTNLDILEKWAPFHQVVLENTHELLEDDTLQYLNEFNIDLVKGDSTSLMRQFITRHAWNYINSQNINFDLQTRFDVIMVYQQQEYVENSLQRLIDLLFERAMLDPEKKKENFIMFYQHLAELYGQEKAMIETYQFRLERLKAILK